MRSFIEKDIKQFFRCLLKRYRFDSLHRFFEAFFLLCQSDAKIPFSRFTETIARRDDHTLFKQARRELR